MLGTSWLVIKVHSRPFSVSLFSSHSLSSLLHHHLFKSHPDRALLPVVDSAWIPLAPPPASHAVCSSPLPTHLAADALEKLPLLTFQKTCVSLFVHVLNHPHTPHRFDGSLSPSLSASSWVRLLRRVPPVCNVRIFSVQVTNLAMSSAVLRSSSYTPKNSLPLEGFTSACGYPPSSSHSHHLLTITAKLSAKTRRQSLPIFVSNTRTHSRVISFVPSSVARIPRVVMHC